MLGELLTILSAMIWALSSVFYKAGLKTMKPTTVNTIRPIVALFFLVGVIIITGDFKDISNLTTRDIIYIFLSTISGVVIGDLLYMFSLRTVGIARAYPISNTYPLFTILMARLFLGEIITFKLISGAILIIIAIFLISEKDFELDIKKGVIFALGASFFWGTSMIIMKLAMSTVNPIVFSTIRMGIFALFLLLYTMRYEKIEFTKINRNWIIVAIGGILDLGVGIPLFLEALKYIDASRAAPLNGTAPIFAIIFTILFTKEKVTSRIIFGVILSFLGVLIIL